MSITKLLNMNKKRVDGRGCGNKLLGQQAPNSPYTAAVFSLQLMLFHLANHMTTTSTTVHGPPQWSLLQDHTNGLNTPPLYWYKFVGVFSQSNSLSSYMPQTIRTSIHNTLLCKVIKRAPLVCDNSIPVYLSVPIFPRQFQGIKTGELETVDLKTGDLKLEILN